MRPFFRCVLLNICNRISEIMFYFLSGKRRLRQIQKFGSLSGGTFLLQRVLNQLFFLPVHNIVKIQRFFPSEFFSYINHAFVIDVFIQQIVNQF